VLIPSTIEECITHAYLAFELAEKYQCPVIVGSDLFLGMSKKSSDSIDVDQYTVGERHIISQDELNSMEPGSYLRYKIDVEDGISPRSIPGQINGRYTALSNEHDEAGTVEIEGPKARKAMFDKRMRKLDGFDLGEKSSEFIGDSNYDLLLLGFGSVRNQLVEAMEELQSKGEKVGILITKLLHPFPTKGIAPYFEKAKRILVVEQNGTGQFRNLLKQHVGYHEKLELKLKYDGNPLTVTEIVEAVNTRKGVITQ
jgi:2-oxoglutarate ferredoxin oxidoreductase subunit alpha